MDCAFIFGTRPEAIKLAPLISTFSSAARIRPVVIVTGQHRGMLDQVLKFFNITPDVDLDLMQHDQSICDLTSRAISGLDAVLQSRRPDMVIVQGDTTTAMCGAYCAAMNRIPVAHVEAGLRSGRRDQPFPEELNRQMIGTLADIHFCATPQAKENLLSEGKSANIHVVGNTVVDALLSGLEILHNGWTPSSAGLDALDDSKRIVLVTLHRRESFGEALGDILKALRILSERHSSVNFFFPVHPNPKISEPVHKVLGRLAGFHLLEPLDYPHFLWLMSKSTVILTDSGGIQEEAPSLGIPLVVARNVTERSEGVNVGVSVLAGTKCEDLVAAVDRLLSSPQRHSLLNPYGDGNASRRIHNVACNFLGIKPENEGDCKEYSPDFSMLQH